VAYRFVVDELEELLPLEESQIKDFAAECRYKRKIPIKTN